MRLTSRPAAAALVIAALSTLVACGGGESASPQSVAATGSPSVAATTSNSEPARSAAPSGMAEPTTSAALPSDPMAAFAAEWSPKLQATKDYPTAAEPADVVQQHAQVAQLQSDFLNAASTAGIGLVNYPGVKKASDDLTRTLLDLDSSECALATPKSVQAFTCATQNLSAKWGAQTLGLTLVTAARS